MSIIRAIIIGLIHGLTEILPVSGSGHLSVLYNIFGLSVSEGEMFFDVLLHFATLVSIVVVFWLKWYLDFWPYSISARRLKIKENSIRLRGCF